MNEVNTKAIKNEHGTDCSCSICGHKYKSIPFKRGYICESCLEYIKDSCTTDDKSSRRNI